jgi:hypothetical protein
LALFSARIAPAQEDTAAPETAPNAEESAAAAEVMHALCEQTYVMVGQLAALVGGNGKTSQPGHHGESKWRATGADSAIRKTAGEFADRRKGKPMVPPP